MPASTVILIVAVAILAVIVAWLFVERRKSLGLRSRFGPEYQRTVEEHHGDRRRAEADLARRQERVQKLHIRSLSRADRERYVEAWRVTQARFVDNPGDAVAQADGLVADVMQNRGYPVTDFDHRVDDISVDHPHVVENYRAAHEIAQQHSRGDATTEDLRKAMVHYRALFEELLETKTREVSR